ncbi:MarR family winged helix-turn-helix transcriptional regulator [Catenuloplanes japonicus]|uniref:MarR family winged helix-turn-helix transcriptional regulator n=1 Tax=Catenuloplanes japonicus TaxID=33876 RepID=UPI000AC8DF43|nr:MarR family winged helix-turn-helix transcriptional regulator [Catenuloplanes japonicus]
MTSPPRTAVMDQLGVLLAGRGAIAGTRVRAALAAEGLTMRSLYTLTRLTDGPLGQQALIDALGVDPSAVVAVLNELENLGLVSRNRDPADRRRHIVSITAGGLSVLHTIEKLLDDADNDLFGALSPAERDQLNGLLLKVADAASCSDKF